MKKILFVISIIFVFTPFLALAQDTNEVIDATEDITASEEIFEAKIVEILEEKEKTAEDGSTYIQQNIKLKGLKGEWKDKEVIFYGISEIETLARTKYKEGEKVLVAETIDIEGNSNYYIVDYIRRGSLYFLAVLFTIVIVAVGKFKGFRAVIALAISFLIIMKFILPKILDGSSPLFISILGSMFILLCIVYFTEGFNKKSHLAIISILISLFLTGLLSVIFTSLTKLTGFAQEETLHLISSGHNFINLQGLLLAAIIIGTLGVLDDVVISQISTVEQIKKANPDLDKKEVYKRAFQVGKSHLGSMVNTLFLAYVGASLPLLLLFTINEAPFLTFSQVINNEILATEIVRTLCGSIGLVLAVPIATLIASRYLTFKK